MDTNEDLVARIEAHCAATGISATAFGRDTVNDSGLMTTLRQGRDLRLSTYRKIVAALDAPPKDTATELSTADR